MNDKRQLWLLGLVSLFSLGLFTYNRFYAPQEEPSPAEETPSTSTPTDEAAAEITRPPEQRFTIRAASFVAELSNYNTAVVAFRPTGERYQNSDGTPMQLVTTSEADWYPQRLEVRGVRIPSDAVWQGEQVSDAMVRFRWTGDGVEVVRQWEIGRTDYQLWSSVRVTNTSGAPREVGSSIHVSHYVTQDAEDAGFIGRPSTAVSFGVCEHGDDVEREAGGDLVEDTMGFAQPVAWVGVTDSYFSNLVAADPPRAKRCLLSAEHRFAGGDEPHGTLFNSELRFEPKTIAPGESARFRSVTYIGPNDRNSLRNAGHRLVHVVDLGWFALIADGLADLLAKIYGFVGNWGIAIILLTLLVKLLFYPLTVKSMRSMAGMRKLKPKLDAINEKYANDAQGKGVATMELYKTEGISPMSGCLPSLLQMPVWFALYRSLSTNIELYHAPFALWWNDLSAPDPYFVLPGLVAVLMHVQQRMTPTTMDAAQAKMMMWMMPIMIGAFMLFLPAGLCLYMVTNSVLTIAQQKAIYAKLDREDANTPTPSGEPTSVVDPDDESGDDSSDSSLAGTTRAARRLERKFAKKRERGRT